MFRTNVMNFSGHFTAVSPAAMVGLLGLGIVVATSLRHAAAGEFCAPTERRRRLSRCEEMRVGRRRPCFFPRRLPHEHQLAKSLAKAGPNSANLLAPVRGL